MCRPLFRRLESHGQLHDVPDVPQRRLQRLHHHHQCYNDELRARTQYVTGFGANFQCNRYDLVFRGDLRHWTGLVQTCQVFDRWAIVLRQHAVGADRCQFNKCCRVWIRHVYKCEKGSQGSRNGLRGEGWEETGKCSCTLRFFSMYFLAKNK